jgi:F-type H+-transporting ATPase subunit gamma
MIFYNEFKNSISFKIQSLELMPKKRFFKNFSRLSVYDVAEPDLDVSKHYYYDFYVATAFYYALLQNAACEQSARMNAMENASKNAGEILDKLTLQYNKARQARITMELVEIISGASAL